MKFQYLLILFLITDIYAENLTLGKKYPEYRIEYDPKTTNIKILSKKNATKACDKEAKSQSTKTLINSQLKRWDKKVIVTFTCR